MADDSLFSFDSILEDYVDTKDDIQLDESVDLVKDPLLNIVEFASSPKGLNFSLRPVQKVILKMLYGIPLDTHVAPEGELTPEEIADFLEKGDMQDENSPVPLKATKQLKFRHPISGIEFGPFSEAEYLDYLKKDGRTNGLNSRVHPKTGAAGYSSLVLSIGRRGGKSTMSTIISCYEIYRLLKMGCPQDHYNLRRNAPITVILVGTDKNQSELLFDDIVSYAVRSPYLKQYLATNLKKEIEFATPYDLSKAGKNRSVKPSLKIRPVSCNAAAIRGVSAIQGIMDEVAHMRSASSKRASAEEVYKALKPALSTFHDSKMIMISSPNGATGYFHKFFMDNYNDPETDVLCIQAPTWEVNPGRIADEDFLLDYNLSKNSFYQEWEAKFEASVRAYIEQLNLFEKVVYPIGEDYSTGELPERPMISKGKSGITYYLSIDQAFKHDGTVFSVGHYESHNDKIIVDFVQKIEPGDERFSLENGRLSSTKVVEEIDAIARRFGILKGFFDLHEGSTFEEKMMDKGLRNIYPISTGETFNSEVYKLFERLYSEERVEIPGISWLMQEFKDLEVRVKSGVGENRKIKVEAGHGAHDDGPDSVVRLVYALYKEMVMGQTVVGDPANRITTDASRHVVTNLRYNDKILQRKLSSTNNKYLSGNSFSGGSRFKKAINPKGRR